MIGDVGDDSWEEIDQLPGRARRPARTSAGTAGRARTPTAPPAAPPRRPIAPIYEYAHDATHCSISGGFVARDPTVPTLAGRYLFADYCGAGASALADPGRRRPRHRRSSEPSRKSRASAQDSDGHLYITSLKGGVWRVTGTGAADKPPVASFTLSSTTPAVGANVHLDASGSTDPDGLIYRYSWDTDGDGKADATGVTADISYPTAGARAITLTVTDAVGAHSSRTQAGLRRRQDDPAGHPDVATKLRAIVLGAGPPETQGRAQARAARPLPDQQACDVDDHDVLGAHDQGAREALPARKRRLSAKTFRAHTGTGRAAEDPARPLAGMQAVVIRVQMHVARARRRRPRLAARSRRPRCRTYEPSRRLMSGPLGSLGLAEESSTRRRPG